MSEDKPSKEDINLFLDVAIEANSANAKTKERTILNEIVEPRGWFMIRELGIEKEVGLAFWHRSSEFGYTPTEEKYGQSRIYYNWNYGDDDANH